MTTGSAQVHIADMKGGDGAADYMVKVAGDMNAQVAGSDRSLNYTSVSGGGLEQVAVPALLVLANNVAPKLVKRGGSTMKISGGKRRGRRGGSEALVAAQAALTAAEKALEDANVELTNAPVEMQAAAQENVNAAQKRVDDAQKLVDELTPKPEPPVVGDANLIGGNMLQQAIVPATLILASNMLGKKGMRKMSLTPKYTKRRSNRRRLNRRKRVSRRFRRGTR